MALNAAIDRRKSICVMSSPSPQISCVVSAKYPVERYFAKKDAVERDVKRFSDEYSMHKGEALEIVAKMRGTKQRFALCYYVLGMTLTEAAYEIDRSYRQVLRIRDAIEGGLNNEDTHEKTPNG